MQKLVCIRHDCKYGGNLAEDKISVGQGPMTADENGDFMHLIESIEMVSFLKLQINLSVVHT